MEQWAGTEGLKQCLSTELRLILCRAELCNFDECARNSAPQWDAHCAPQGFAAPVGLHSSSGCDEVCSEATLHFTSAGLIRESGITRED